VAEREVVMHYDWEPLSSDAIVVRGGKMADDLAYNAKAVFLESALRGICGGAAEPPMTALEIVLATPYRGSWVCEAKLGDLRQEGFDVVMIDDLPHCVILLNSEDLNADWEGWDRLRSRFSEPRHIGSR
jgi:hypothetical protein